jgi:hypothetical protein
MTRDHPQENSPCECGVLEKAAEDAANPIIFDVELNEYQLEYEPPKGRAKMMIYFCPFCGGKAPASKRDRFFARVTDEEYQRLRNLTKNIKTINDAIELFGVPEVDSYEEVISPEKKDTPEKRQAFRCVVYSNLSDTADIRITDYHRETVSIVFEGKYTGEERQDSA